MTSNNSNHLHATADHSQVGAKPSSIAIASIDDLIDAQVAFMTDWLRKQALPLATDAWQWLGTQPMSRYVSAEDLQRLINEWLLTQPMSKVMRADIRDILQTVIYHPANDNVALSELIDDTQIDTLATYIGSHEQQRNGLIHTLIGNEAFAQLLTKTLYHAINDFTESTLDKAGGVGKLMKMGRSSFERATNHNLDERLQTYLHRNIKDLAGKAEANAQAHLSNDEVSRLLVSGWARIKDKPVSELQNYLNNDPDNGSIHHIEASAQQSYNLLRPSPYLHSLISASIETWYANHASDSIATLAGSVYIDEQAIARLNKALLPLIHDAIDSAWFITHLQDMLKAFYGQSTIKSAMPFN